MRVLWSFKTSGNYLCNDTAWHPRRHTFKCHIDKHAYNPTGTDNTNRNKQEMLQKSCGDYLDDLFTELQVMLQEALWQSELFVWVCVWNMRFHNCKKWQWTYPGQEHHPSHKVSSPYTYGSYNTRHALFQNTHQIHRPNEKLRNRTAFMNFTLFLPTTKQIHLTSI